MIKLDFFQQYPVINFLAVFGIYSTLYHSVGKT